MTEDHRLKRCRVELIPDKILGWRLKLEGCEDELKAVKSDLGPHGLRYFQKRVTLIEEEEAETEETPTVEEEQASEESEAEE